MDQNYNTEAIRLAAKSAITACLIFAACLMIGVPFWKACVAATLVAIIHRAGMYRRLTEGVAFAVIVVATVRWIEVLPARADMAALDMFLWR